MKKYLFLLFLILSACGGGKTGNEDTPSKPPEEPPLEPGNTYTLISRTRPAADGFSDLVAKIKIQDPNGTPVPRVVLRLLSSVEDGINYARCEDSDSQGISNCIIRAHRDGVKHLTIAGTEKTVQMEFTRNFDARGVLLNVVPLAHKKIAAGSDLVSGVAGPRYDVPIQQSGSDLIINDISVSD